MVSEQKGRIVYIIGAGLSAGLGFPTIQDLLPKLWHRLERANIASDIAEVIRFHHPNFNANRRETYPTIEQLLSEMQANADLFDSTRPATGRFTADHLEERRGELLYEVALWFHELKEEAIRSKPRWMKSLTRNMRNNEASVISFNWDLVLEHFLFTKPLNKGSYGLKERHTGPRLIKPHGSLNWYESDSAKPIKADKKFVLTGNHESGVFAFRRLRAPLSKVGRRYMPLVVPPVFAKQFEGPLFQRLWQETVRALSTATEVRFLGYSMANADFHARFVMRCGFYNQEHGQLDARGNRSAPTGRAKVVIVDPSEEAAERIRGCVGWDCEIYQERIDDWIDRGGLNGR